MRRRARQNRGVHAVDPRSRGAREYQRMHWGIPARQRIRWDDPLLPDELVQMGRLVKLDVVNGSRRWSLRFAGRQNHVVWDPEPGKLTRLYLLVAKPYQRRFAAQFDPRKAFTLRKVAVQVGGRQRQGGYPGVKVTPLGYLAHVTYDTKKRGDDVEIINQRVVGRGSYYIHEMGEAGGIRPALCVDAQGRLWLAGGSYHVETHGIMR